MVRKVSPSQFKSKMRAVQRQAESKMKQAVNKYNQDVNRKLKSAINDYNRTVKNKMTSELRKLQSSSYTTTRTTYSTYYRTSLSLNSSYESVLRERNILSDLSPEQEYIYGLAEQENINNLETSNAIINDDIESELEYSEIETELSNKLYTLSEDLKNRWKGAIFSLNPNNPDATRHFCTSAREIFTEIIEISAPDEKVFNYKSNCQITERGNPTRREKIGYLINKKDLVKSMIEFADKDIDNVLKLFHVLSDGTHGQAGKYSIEKLNIVKKRVEDGLYFLCNIAM